MKKLIIITGSIIFCAGAGFYLSGLSMNYPNAALWVVGSLLALVIIALILALIGTHTLAKEANKHLNERYEQF